LRILYLTHSVSWKGGGIFFTAYHQARHLASRGHEVILMSVPPQNRFRFSESISNGVRLLETPDWLPGMARSGWDPWDMVRRIFRLKNMKFDLIHGFESRPIVAVPALYQQFSKKVPLIFTWADWFGRGGKGAERGFFLKRIMDPVETFCEDYFMPKAFRCIAMGQPLLDRALALGIPRDKLLLLLHGCDPSGIKPMTRLEARSQLSHFNPSDTILGYMGVMRPSSARLLIEAFRQIRQYALPNCKLLLIGNIKLPIDEYLDADIKPAVVRTGWLQYDHVNLHLAACDLLLLPLQRAVATDNVWPSKLNDYLAIGRPTVATDMQSIRPIFQKYGVGILTDDDPRAFAEGCIAALRDQSAWDSMAKNARHLAEGDLSWNHIVDRLEVFYQDAIRAFQQH
jgi:glycosyltransferase involved in cell wall biosynthesis